MAITYEFFTQSDKILQVRQRIKQLEQNHYDQDLERISTEASTQVTDDERTAMLSKIDGTQENIEKTIEAHRAELNRLLGSTSTEEPAKGKEAEKKDA